LKTQNPELLIDFVVRAEYADLLKLNPHINRLYSFSRSDEENKKIKLDLLEMKYECIIDLQNNLRSKFLLQNLSGEVYSFNKKRFEKVLLVHTKINLLKDAPPIPVRYAQTVPTLRLDDQGLEIFLPEDCNPRIKSGEKVIGLCPGARHFTKRWPKEYFSELGKMLSSEGFTLALLGGKSDKEICGELTTEIPGSIDLSTEDDILQLAGDMKQCKAVLCNDSGLMHTACAVNVPVVAIFGSTTKAFGFVPYGGRNIILENNSLSCRPCSHIGKKKCPQKHFRCMLEVTPQHAFDSLKEILKS